MSKMRGLLQASLAVTAVVLFVLGIQADQPNRPQTGTGAKANFNKNDLAAKERELADRYRDFEQSLLILKQRLERSDRKEDRDRAAVLGKVLEKSSDISLSTRFGELVRFLSTQKFSNVGDVKSAAGKAGDLARDLKLLIDLLRNNTDLSAKREEKLRLEKILEELKVLIRKQRGLNGQFEDGRGNPKEVARNQREVQGETRAVEKKLGNLNKDDKNDKNGQGGEAKDNKGEAKGAKGKGAKGEGKNSGKQTEAKKGDGKDAGKGGEGKKGEAKDNAKAGQKGGEPKAGNPKAGPKGEAKPGKAGDKKQGDAKSGKGGEAKQGGQAKSGKGSESKKGGEAKAGGQQGDKKQGQAKADGEKNKVRTKADDKQGQAKEGGKKDGQKGDKQGGAKSSQGGDKKSSQSKGDKSAQSKQGQSKSSKSKGGQGSPKSGGQPQQPPQGDAKDDNNNKKKPDQLADNTTLDARKRVRDAENDMRNAAKKVEDKKNRGALKDGEDAVDNLEKARKKLEDLLRQLREEELERLLTELKARCEKMLAMQIQVYNGTKAVARAIDGNADKKPKRENTQDSLGLSDEEKKIVHEATKAIDMLEAEGSAVAFHEVFMQIRDDMKNVQRRLGAVDVGKVTQAVEQDIIDTLNEMIKALEKAKQELKDKKAQPGQSGPPPPHQDQKLLDQIAELKMIRAMQLRVNARTTLYGRQFPGEQANEPQIQRELRNLGDRQDRIFEVTNKIAKGDNR